MFTLKHEYKKSSKLFTVTWLVLALGIFLIDCLIPLGVADGVLYVTLVLVGLLYGERKLIIWGAILGTLLNIAGFGFSPSGGELWKVLLNRFLSIFTIWMTAGLCLLQNRSETELEEAHNKLEERVHKRTSQLDEANRLLQRESSFIQLLKNIAVASNEARAVEDTLQYCLKEICNHAGWPVGHLYLCDEETGERLVSSTIWHLENPEQFETFRSISEATAFAPGIGLPGRVLASGMPAWIIDVTKDSNFPRAQLVENLGVRAGFAFPILIGREVVAIMEFFSAEASEPREEMLEIMAQIGTQLGRVLERQRAEQGQKRLLRFLEQRVNEQTCLYQVARVIGASKTIREVFRNVESSIVLGWTYPDIARVKIDFEGEVFVGRSFKETPWKLSAPIIVHGQPHGTLAIYYTEACPELDEGPFKKEERELINGLAHLLSVAAQRKLAEEEVERSRQQLRNLYHRLEMVREEERTRIAREIHDELAQVLTTIKLQLSVLQKKIQKRTPELQKELEFMQDLTDKVIPSVKELIQDLRPPILDDLGLRDTIYWQGTEFERRTGIRFELDPGSEEVELDTGRATTMFRIFQETLTNVARHAKANKIVAKLDTHDDILTLLVRDDGVGIRPENISNGKSLGILGMRERARVWGGDVEFTGIPGKGTTVAIKISRS